MAAAPQTEPSTGSQKSTNARATNDGVIFRDERVLQILLETHKHYLPTCSYLKEKDGEIRPYMRKLVTSWMLEACVEMGCEDQVFPLAVNYLDRVLSQYGTPKEQLQPLGAACLLIACKLRMYRCLGIQQLVQLTDYSTSESQLRSLELSILARLNWDINAITAFDFVEQLLTRLNLGEKEDLIRRHAHTFVAVCATDPDAARWPSPLVAGAAVSASVVGMKLLCGTSCPAIMSGLLGVTPARLTTAVFRLEKMAKAELADREAPGGLYGGDEDRYLSHRKNMGDDPLSLPDTPTDIERVDF